MTVAQYRTSCCTFFSRVSLFLAALILVASASCASALYPGNTVSVGFAPHGIGTGGDQVEEDLYRFLGQQDTIDSIYLAQDAENFFEVLGKIKKSGKRIGALVVAGHGSAATPGVGFSRGNLLPNNVDYCFLKREAFNRLQRINKHGAKAGPKIRDEYRAIKKQVELRDAAAGVMAPNGLVIILSCSVAATLPGKAFLNNLGSLLLADGGGRIVGSAVDNTTGQFKGWMDQLGWIVRNWTYDEVGNYFVYGDFKEFPIKGSHGTISCPGIPEKLPDIESLVENGVEGWNGTWSLSSKHMLPPVKDRSYPSTLIVRVNENGCRYDWGKANRNRECQATPRTLTLLPKHPSGTELSITLTRQGNSLIPNESKFSGQCGDYPCRGTYSGHR